MMMGVKEKHKIMQIKKNTNLVVKFYPTRVIRVNWIGVTNPHVTYL